MDGWTGGGARVLAPWRAKLLAASKRGWFEPAGAADTAQSLTNAARQGCNTKAQGGLTHNGPFFFFLIFFEVLEIQCLTPERNRKKRRKKRRGF